MKKTTRTKPTGAMTEEAWTLYIRDRIVEQIKTSKEYRDRYEKLNDPEVVIEFIRRNHFALKEGWVIKIVISWIQTGERDLLKRAFLPHKGESPKKYQKTAFNFFLTERVDRLVEQGMTKTMAFQTVKPPTDIHLDPGRIRNIYYATKKKKPQIYIQRTAETLTITAFPAKIQFDVDGKTLTFFGNFEYSIPLKI